MIKLFSREGKFVSEFTVENTELFNTKLKRKNSILDILMKRDLPITHGCFGGSCGACICQIREGIEHVDSEGLHKQVYKNAHGKEVLTCISTIKEDTPKDAVIEIRTKLV